MKERRRPWSILVFALTLTLLSGVSSAASSSAQLVLSKSSMNFGNVVLGSATQVVEIISNPTSGNVSIATATIEGTSFQIGNASFPMTLGPRQQVSIPVTFNALAAGNASGSLLISLDGTSPYFTVPLYGIGVIPGQLTASPAAVSVTGAPSQRIPETVTNSGATNIWLQTATISGSGFSLSGPPLPMLLKPGQSANFVVSMSSTGNASGSIQVAGMVHWWTWGERGVYQSAATTPTKLSLVIPVSETTAVAGQLTAAPSAISFGNVQTGNTQNLPATLTNSGAGPVAITGATATGSGFSVGGLPLPMTLTPGESVTFSASFAPQSSGNSQGNIAIISNASNSTVNLALSGSASAPGQLALSPATLNFGNVIVGKSQKLTASLAASGSSVTVSSASFSGSEFSLSGMQLPVTIPAGQSASFTVTFSPQASGSASASLSFSGTAPSAVESLSGAGSPPPQHSVALSWSADSSTVAGYNVYRGTQTGGPYTKLTSAPAPSTNYGDIAVTSGQTYFYVTTAVDNTGAESAHSNEVQAAIPSP